MSQIKLGDIAVDVVLKDIKNVHLSVHPPTGRVRISAPKHMKIDTLRVFAISKLDWIKQQQTKLNAQERDSEREYLDRESHYVWGRRYLLNLKVEDAAPRVELHHARLVLRIRPGSDEAARETVLARWYRQLLKVAVSPLIAAWEPRLNVTVSGYYVQRMKTKWGSCNPIARTIRLNTELAKKPSECLEYVVLHEMAHLLEPTHGPRFVALMDKHLPSWRFHRQELNSSPLAHESWSY